MERLSRGEAVDPALVYCRTVPVFEAPAGPYDWLNRSIFLAVAARLPDKVQIARVRGDVGLEPGADRVPLSSRPRREARRAGTQGHARLYWVPDIALREIPG